MAIDSRRGSGLAIAVFQLAKRREPGVVETYHRLRAQWLALRLRATAVWRRADVEISIGPGVRIGRGLQVVLTPETSNVLRIGEGSRLGDRILIQLNGGTVILGERSDVRRDVVLNVAGHLELQHENQLSWGSVVHCNDRVIVEPLAGIAEQVTIADSSHYHTEPDSSFYHNVRSSPVVIGRNTWICAKAVIARGTHVGAWCIVAAGSVVTRDVPDGHLASGIPAEVVGPLPLPWTLHEVSERTSS